MMKAGRCIVKLIAVLAALAAAAYLIKTYWETLEDIFYTVVGKIKEAKAQYCCCECSSEAEHFADEDSMI